MSTLGKDITHFIQCVAVRHRVAVVEERGPAIVVPDARTIASPVPYVRLDPGRDAYHGRRCRLAFPGSPGSAIRARVRDLPAGISPRARITSLRDRLGRERAASAADPDTRTLHLLVEIDRATPDGEPAAGLAAAVAEALVAPGIADLVGATGPVWRGEGVREAVHTLLERRARAARPRFEREIAFLHRVGRERPLSGILAARLKMLEQAAAGGATRKVDADAAERETERLERLVESRACASLRVSDDGIRGLINPAPTGGEAGHGALMFALHPGPPPAGPRLRMWRAGEPEHGTSRTMCLGEAAGILSQMEHGQDAYGLVDTVLNFVETNAVGWMPLDTTPGPFPFPPALEHLF